MSAKMKRRLAAVTGIIAIVLVVMFAVVGGSTSAKTVSVGDLANGDMVDARVKVSGNVVPDSYAAEDGVLTFSIYDPAGGPDVQVPVRYEGSVSATFGNDVTAICTGRMTSDGVLACSELVTKCPSKYENASDALTVARLLEYGADIEGKVVKVTGVVEAGTLTAAGRGERFVLADGETSDALPVLFDGALPDAATDGSALVLTGALDADGAFTATDVALEG